MDEELNGQNSLICPDKSVHYFKRSRSSDMYASGKCEKSDLVSYKLPCKIKLSNSTSPKRHPEWEGAADW